LTDFCAAHEVPVDAKGLGVEFEADGYRVLMTSDPRDPDRMLVAGIDRAEALENPRKNLAEVSSMTEDAQLSAAGALSQLVRF
jgi:Ni,Fe-hydrogenase III small subunit